MSENLFTVLERAKGAPPQRWVAVHALLAAALNLYITVAIYRAFQIPGPSAVAAMKTLLLWTVTVNLFSAALIITFTLRASWVSRPARFMMLDSITASLPLLVIPVIGKVHAFGVLYTLFIFSKLGVLVAYAITNCSRILNLMWPRFWVLATSFLIYAGITPWVALAAWPNGDEPAYLTLTHSLLKDHDFDLTDNYQRHDYQSFFPPSLPGAEEGYPRSAREHDTLVAITQQHHTVPGRHHDELLWHDVGMPILILPGYAVAGRLGAMLELDLFAALLALGSYEVALELGGTHGAALLAWSLFAFTSPILVYSSQVFPEMLGGTFTLLAVLAFTKSFKTKRASPLLLIGLFVAVLPWLCIRYWILLIPLIAVVALHTVISTRNSIRLMRDLTILAAPLLLSLSMFAWFDKQHFNTMMPNAGYLLIVSMQPQFGLRPDIGFLGLLLDRGYGLLPIAPIYLIALAGIPEAWRRSRWVTTAIVLPSCTYIVFMVFSRFWFAGWAPAGRYMMSGIVLWVPLAALALSQARHPYLILAISTWTLLVSFGHTAFPLTRYPALRDHTKGGLAQLSTLLMGRDLSTIFPSLIRATSADIKLAAVWALVAVCCLWFLSRPARNFAK